ncbi:MAG: alkaline phosphatase family protein [Gammaproteobacteria bacterium]|nr:alkaline phosphatase family protein [Gammaproteobacteria bacterium]
MRFLKPPLSLVLAVSCATGGYAATTDYTSLHGADIRHVLLISIDGMHALDYANCAGGIPTVNGGAPYCAHLAALGEHAVNYVAASTSKPSDSFPGVLALVTGGSTRSTGVFYDVSYDRTLSPPKASNAISGLAGGDCPGQKGTQVIYDESIDIDTSRVDAGGGINPDYLPRDPANNCAPVYPHQFLRANTLFEVVRAAGGYTAWTDKHPAYDLLKGPSGNGLDDFYGPEINSSVVALPGIPGCETVADPTATGAWTDSFQNIQCYDTLHLKAVLNQIDGKTHDGKPARVPSVFGANFQSVSVGQKLNEKSLSQTGGYLDVTGTPSAGLLNEIEFVDNAVGKMIAELKQRGLYESTLIIITAKHGQSPLDPKALLRIPADNKSLLAPSDVVGSLAAASMEDDVSMLWLVDQGQTANAVAMLSADPAVFGGGEIFAGKSLGLIFNDPTTDSRSPDILVTPTAGVVYTGGTKKLAEHGGFSHDDTNVVLLLAHPRFESTTIASPVQTSQVAPTILKALGLNSGDLKAVREEYTQVLPGFNRP